jgi:hypothetical protein
MFKKSLLDNIKSFRQPETQLNLTRRVRAITTVFGGWKDCNFVLISNIT